VLHSTEIEHCQVKHNVTYVENTVKMYRIGMQICILFSFQGCRDELCSAHSYWSSHWCMNASLFVPLSSTAVPLDHVPVWRFISRTSGRLVWRIQFRVFLNLFFFLTFLLYYTMSSKHKPLCTVYWIFFR
jgi:hypothetical protein